MTRPVLRPYQVRFERDVHRAWRSDPDVIGRMPTGAGKTVTACSIVDRVVRKWAETVVIVVHRIELRRQWDATLRAYGLEPGVIAPGVAPDPTAPVQVAQIGALLARVRAGHRWSLRPVCVMIIDEAHHAAAQSYRSLLELVPRRGLLGLTATPARLDGKGLRPPFSRMVSGPEVPELIEAGALSDYVIRGVTADSLAGVRKTAGDYNRKDLAERQTERKVADAVHAWHHESGGRQTLAFAVDRAHGRRLQAQMRDAGIRAGYADGAMGPAERRRAFEAFEQRHDTVLVTVDLIGEGYDCPACECVLLCRPTMSIPLHLQQCGRPLRPSPHPAVIIDTVGNTDRLGGPRTAYEWTLDGVARRAGRNGQPREAAESTAPREAEVIQTTMVTIDDASFTVRKSRNGWSARDVAIAKRRCNELRDYFRLASQLGYSRTWALIQHRMDVAKGRAA